MRLYCFSPLVMLATFAIEIIAALYVLWRYRIDRVTRIAIAMLCCLAFFQLAEYNVCEAAFGLDGITWSRLGYVAITFLPALGVHFVLALAQRPNGWLLTACYGVAVTLSAFFLFATTGISGHQCMGNYAIFQVSGAASYAHGTYYWLLLATGVGLSIRYARSITGAKRDHQKRALYGLALSYTLFMAPTIVAIYTWPEVFYAIPSVMCGFAVIFAIMITWYVLPQYYNGKKPTKNHRLPRRKAKNRRWNV